MLYAGYQAFSDMMEPARMLARAAVKFRDSESTLQDWPMVRRLYAVADTFASAAITHARPPFGITEVLSGNAMTPVREEVVASRPFGDLLHFAKDDVQTPQPKMLVVAPLSGHFATLLRNTVETLLRDHDVYITDWRNARDVPLDAGHFGFDEYVDYLIDFMHELGPRTCWRCASLACPRWWPWR
jgi:poly(3-hydroxybutyrate) depolymerase